MEPIIISGNIYLWREWNVTPSAAKPLPRHPEFVLTSTGVGKSFVWEDRVVEARCLAQQGEAGGGIGDGRHAPPSPAEGCTCGIWGYATLEDLLLNSYGGIGVSTAAGMFLGFGAFVFHQFGARSQFARPELICLDPNAYPRHNVEDYVAGLTARYGCEVRGESIQEFFTREAAAERSVYPALGIDTPETLLDTMTIPAAEADLGGLNWKEIGKDVADRPTCHAWHRDPESAAGDTAPDPGAG